MNQPDAPPHLSANHNHCASCGAEFICGMSMAKAEASVEASAPFACWCEALPVLAPAHRLAGTGCLCPACLAAELARSANPPAPLNDRSEPD